MGARDRGRGRGGRRRAGSEALGGAGRPPVVRGRGGRGAGTPAKAKVGAAAGRAEHHDGHDGHDGPTRPRRRARRDEPGDGRGRASGAWSRRCRTSGRSRGRRWLAGAAQSSAAAPGHGSAGRPAGCGSIARRAHLAAVHVRQPHLARPAGVVRAAAPGVGPRRHRPQALRYAPQDVGMAVHLPRPRGAGDAGPRAGGGWVSGSAGSPWWRSSPPRAPRSWPPTSNPTRPPGPGGPPPASEYTGGPRRPQRPRAVPARASSPQRVQYRYVDMSEIPDDLTGFDFTWSSCAFEHLGDLAAGRSSSRARCAAWSPVAWRCIRPS